MRRAIIPVLLTLAVIHSSTTMGSITNAVNFAFAPTPAYKITKAALNMLTKQYALDLDKDGFTVLAISPGVSEDDSDLMRLLTAFRSCPLGDLKYMRTY